jgi:hypothetical protein
MLICTLLTVWLITDHSDSLYRISSFLSFEYHVYRIEPIESLHRHAFANTFEGNIKVGGNALAVPEKATLLS